jgi:peptide/nickel transport system substrate-binding protein
MNRFVLALAAVLVLHAGAWAAGTLTVCDDVRDPATLDPHKQFSEKNHTIVQQIYDGLVRFGPDGQVEPALALSWSYPDQTNPTRVRFVLRQGVKFHNGEPFNAEAARFSIARYLDPKTGFPAIGFIDSIAACEVVDEHTIDIVTKYPDGLLLNRLAGFMLMVPPKYVAEHGEAALHEKPVGTGAFKFVAWDKGHEIRLTANPDYWLAGFPKLEGLTFRFVPADQQVKQLLKGEVDLVTELPGTMTMAVESNANTRVLKHKAFWTVSATMNTTSGPLADVRIRKAMNMAIDRTDLVKFDSMGNGTPIATLTMEGEGGHNPQLKPYAFDIAAANKLLDEAGVQRPVVLKTLVRTQSDRAAHIIAAQLAKIGVKLEFKGTLSDGEIIQRIMAARMGGGETFDIAIGGGPDPMCHAFFMQSIMMFSQSPFSLQQDKAFDGQLIGMVTQLDPAKREQQAQAIDQYIHDNALSLFTYQKIKTYGQRRSVEFTPYISTMPYFFATSVSATAAAAPAKTGVSTLSASDSEHDTSPTVRP